MNRSRLTRFVRLLLGLGLLAYLVTRLPGGALLEALARCGERPTWLAAGFCLTFLGLLMGALRWRVVLKAQGLHVQWADVFQIFFIGQFFNAFMPGACGGDMARAYYVAQGEPKLRTEAVSTVFVDRAVGLFATVVVACVAVLLRLPFFLQQPQTRLAGLLMLAFLVASVLGILALFRRNLFTHWSLFRRIEHGSALGPLIRRAYEAFYLYRDQHRAMSIALALSVLNLLFLTLACLVFGMALAAPLAHPVIDHLTLFPVITTLAAVPLTPGALGLREGLFVALYGAVGLDAVHALTLSLLVYAGGLAWSLVGGIFFVGRSAAEHHGLRSELQNLREGDGGA